VNPTWTDAQTWLDIADHALIGLVVIMAAGIPSWLAARNHRSIRDIKDQVVNSHPETNLRDDLDRAIAAVESLAHDVRNLRGDLMQEEDRRRIQIGDLRDELEHRTAKHRRDPLH
jgi:hypothetical protein